MSTWSFFSSGWEHVKRKMHPCSPTHFCSDSKVISIFLAFGLEVISVNVSFVVISYSSWTKARHRKVYKAVQCCWWHCQSAFVVVVVDDFDTLVVVVDVNAFVVVDVNTFVVVLLFLTMLTTREDWEKSIKRCSVVNGPANQIIRHRDITTEGSRRF